MKKFDKDEATYFASVSAMVKINLTLTKIVLFRNLMEKSEKGQKSVGKIKLIII